MSEEFEEPQVPAMLNYGWHEMEGAPRPGVEETADEAIYKVMIEQRREANKRNLPDLND